MNKLVVGIGEIARIMSPHGKKIGGAPAHFAYVLMQLGINSKIISAVGHDKEADEIISRLDELGMCYELSRRAYPTGKATINKNEDKKEYYEMAENAAWDHIPFTSQLAEIAEQTGVVFFDTLGQRDPESRHTIRRFIDALPSEAIKVCDLNLSAPFYTKELVRETLQLCDVLKMDFREFSTIKALFGWPDEAPETGCRRLMACYDLDTVILTQGTEDTYVFGQGDRSVIHTKAANATVTIGIDDAFTAGFITAKLRGKTLHEAHRLGLDLASFFHTRKNSNMKVPVEIRRRF